MQVAKKGGTKKSREASDDEDEDDGMKSILDQVFFKVTNGEWVVDSLDASCKIGARLGAVVNGFLKGYDQQEFHKLEKRHKKAEESSSSSLSSSMSTLLSGSTVTVAVLEGCIQQRVCVSKLVATALRSHINRPLQHHIQYYLPLSSFRTQAHVRWLEDISNLGLTVFSSSSLSDGGECERAY